MTHSISFIAVKKWIRNEGYVHLLIELPFVFVEAVFVTPRSEELGIAT